MMYFIVLLVIFTNVAFSEAAATGTTTTRPIVEIEQGKLEGTNQLSRKGRTYFSFKGIPFGKSKRFQDSEFADGWNVTRDASKYGQVCLQLDYFKMKVTGDEDCLFLNIYTPKLGTNETDGEKLLPVMVFIHGGGWQFGSGEIGGKYFADEDVVLVGINYRVGLFGFADTGSTANVGLKDQLLALKWVKQNIRAFGGNPDSVTIFGESAGSGSANFHILSPLGKGLFHRGISQSATANSPFATTAEPYREFRKLGILVDCPISNTEYLLQCLEKVDGAYMLNRIRDAAKLPGFKASDIPTFLPSVDKNSKGNVYLPDTPLNIMESGNFEKVPWIAGVNTLEAIFMPGTESLRNLTRTEWNASDAKSLQYDKYDCKGIENIRKFYMGDVKNATDASEAVTNMLSDRFFNHPTKVAAIHHAKQAPTYLYHFALRVQNSFLGASSKADADGLRRPAHADELQFQFEFPDLFPEITDSKFVEFSEYFVKLWATFAKDGVISPNEISTKASAWTQIPKTAGLNDEVEWFQLDNESKMVKESAIFGTRLNFWNDLLAKKQ